MQSDCRLSIACVVYFSSLRQLQTLFDSLNRSLELAAIQADVFLVDNSVDDDYHRQLQKFVNAGQWPRFFNLNLLQSETNQGYGAANNLAINRSGSPFHLITNPDVAVHEGALKAGLDFLDAHPNSVMAVPRTLDPDSGEIEYTAKRYPNLLVLLARFLGLRPTRGFLSRKMARYECRDLLAKGDSFEVPLASGCFMLCRRQALTGVQGFDPGYFLYFEDFDLSIRMRRRGSIIYVPSMVITHSGGGAGQKGGGHGRLFIRSALRFFNAHGWRLC